MLLKGQKVRLRPMNKDEVALFYKWATQSDATPFWYGELYRNKIPTFKKFFEDWKPDYFNDLNPQKGRCFVILLDKEKIGQINYNAVDSVQKRVEIDILIADAKNWGEGYGPDAIRILINYLFEEMNVKEVWIAAIKKNPRAIRAYQKAGFKIIEPYESIKKDPHWASRNLEEWIFLSYKK